MQDNADERGTEVVGKFRSERNGESSRLVKRRPPHYRILDLGAPPDHGSGRRNRRDVPAAEKHTSTSLAPSLRENADACITSVERHHVGVNSIECASLWPSPNKHCHHSLI